MHVVLWWTSAQKCSKTIYKSPFSSTFARREEPEVEDCGLYPSQLRVTRGGSGVRREHTLDQGPVVTGTHTRHNVPESHVLQQRYILCIKYIVCKNVTTIAIVNS